MKNHGEVQYYHKYQEQEKKRMSTQVNKVPDSLSKVMTLSEMEVDTIGAASTSFLDESSKNVQENLRQKFNMQRNERGMELPIFKCRNELIDKIEAYPVTVISGATGCGKSTQIPQFILDHQAAKDRYF